MIFPWKCSNYIILYQLTSFECHTFFRSRDIKQNVLLNSYLDKCWGHKFQDLSWINGWQGKIERNLEIQKFEYFENEKSFLDEVKSIFYNDSKAHCQVWNNSWRLKPFKKMKNAFYFTSKALFVLKIFKFLSWRFCHVAKRLDKNWVNFKIYDLTVWLTNNRAIHIAKYFKQWRQSDHESVNKM